MLLGKRRKISGYTQFVPLLTFASFFLQLVLVCYFVDFKDAQRLYEAWSVAMPCYFIFFSLAMSHHYLWVALLYSPLFVIMMIYYQIKTKLYSDGFDDQDEYLRIFIVITFPIILPALIVFISYQSQLAISEAIIDKHREAKQNRQLNQYFNSQADGIILYTKPERAHHRSEERYRIQECENNGSRSPENLC